MIDTQELVASVYGTLGEAFPGIPLWDKDLDKIKDNEKPCYVVELGEINDYLFNGSYVAEDVEITVFYFEESRNEGYAKLLKKKKELFKALSSPHFIDGFGWEAIGVDFDISREDMVLSCLFTVNMIQDATEEREADLEPMEELDYNEEEL